MRFGAGRFAGKGIKPEGKKIFFKDDWEMFQEEGALLSVISAYVFI